MSTSSSRAVGERAGRERTRAVDVLGSVRATLGMSPAQWCRRVEQLEAELARISAGGDPNP